MAKSSTSSASAAADAEKTANERAAATELASRQAALDAAKANVDRLASIAAANVPTVAAVAAATIVAAPSVPSWTPAETMSADAVRVAVAEFLRSVLAPSKLRGIGVMTFGGYTSLLAPYEPNQLNTLIGAMERGGGLKAAPRHNEECLEYAEYLASRGKPANCVGGCPLLGYKAPTASAPRAAGSTTASTGATGRSKGNACYNGPTNPTASCSNKQAAVLAVVDYPNATILTDALARTSEQNFRPILLRAVVKGQVPAGTFGVDVVAEITPELEAEVIAETGVAPTAIVPTPPVAAAA